MCLVVQARAGCGVQAAVEAHVRAGLQGGGHLWRRHVGEHVLRSSPCAAVLRPRVEDSLAVAVFLHQTVLPSRQEPNADHVINHDVVVVGALLPVAVEDLAFEGDIELAVPAKGKGRIRLWGQPHWQGQRRW